MKVVINTCYGGFGLSDAAYEKLIQYGIPVRAYTDGSDSRDQVIYDRTLDKNGRYTVGRTRYWDIWTNGDRTNPLIIRVVEELGAEANGNCSELKIIHIPDDVRYTIEDYDGIEHVAEKHSTWS